MPAVRVAVSLKCLQLPLAKAVAKAREMGANAVDIDARGGLRPADLTPTAVREVRKLLEDHELKVSAVEFQTRRGYGDLEELDRRVEATKAAMRMARQLGCDLVVNQVGQVPDDLTSNEGQTLVEVLRDLGEHSQHAGAWIAAATGSETGADLRRLIDALPKGTLFAALDPGALLINSFGAMEAAEALSDTIRHVRATDAVRDLGRKRGLEVQLGRGAVDWPVLVGLLETQGYRGYYSVVREAGDDVRLEIAQGVRYLASL
ncbi:MAG: sugar phosphate isomerase/epimerase family protein [Pirellulales bacterium]